MPVPPLQRQYQAAALAGRLPPLLLAAQRVAATVAQGVHGRRRVGPGDAFWQFRPYTSSDPAQRIDWRQSARGNRLFVRETEWEAAQSVYLWCDSGPSMDFASKNARQTKGERAELLLLALANLLVDAGERVSLLGGQSTPVASRAGLERLALLLEQQAAPADPGTPPDATAAAQPVPRFAQLILIGDFLAPVDRLQPVLARYAERGIGAYVLQVLDPAEETLPFDGRIRFEAPGGGGDELIPRVQSIRKTYQQRFNAHRDALQHLIRGLGWQFASHRTDHAPQTALLSAYNALTGG